MGNTAEELVENYRLLRSERNSMEHIGTPEDVLDQVMKLSKRRCMPYVQQEEPFLYAAVMGAHTLAVQLLAKPRLLQLAALVLKYCQDSLDWHPNARWKWTSPRPHKRQDIVAWIAAQLQSVPELGNNSEAFAEQAGAVQEEAAQYGQLQLHYTPAELRQRLSMCQRVGLFDEAVQARNSFAFLVVAHMDRLLQHLLYG